LLIEALKAYSPFISGPLIDSQLSTFGFGDDEASKVASEKRMKEIMKDPESSSEKILDELTLRILDRTTGTPVTGKALDMGGETTLPSDPIQASNQLDEEIERCKQQLGFSPVRGVESVEVE